MDIWIPAAGLAGLIVPIPSLVWTWRRWTKDVHAQNGHGRKHFITLASLWSASLAVVSWLLAVLCFFRHRSLPFEVCEPKWSLGIMGLLCVLAIAFASFGAKRCRWTTILCAFGMVLYFLSLGALIE